jgi:Tol biopolymer transport system component/DNA-binding winged helix-turn-helix (wHTH) protein
MEKVDRSARLVRFGVFEANLQSKELHKNGVRVLLQGQPFQVCALLLEHSGELVTREELRQKVWPEDTFVDFEQALNTAIAKIRVALGDDADNPRFVETLPRRGYRFIGPVDKPISQAPLAPKGGFERLTAKARWISAGATLVLVLGAAVSAYFLTRASPVPKVSNYIQLTHDGHPKSLIGTDGARLYLGVPIVFAYKAITQVSISGGEPTPIPPPSHDMIAVDVSPDGSELLVLDTKSSTAPATLWSLPILGGSPRRLGDIVAHAAAWSRDGGMLAYWKEGGLFLAKADGTESRKLATTKDFVQHLVWSPDGSHLQFDAVENVDLRLSSLWEVSVDGTDLHPLLLGHNSPHDCCGRWTADGKYFVFESNNQIWALGRKGGGSLHSESKPIQLTSSPLSLSSPLPSKDRKKMFVIGELLRGELTRYNSKLGEFSPFLGGISAEYVANSNDGQWVAYVSYPEGMLWRSKSDRSDRLQLTYAPLNPWLPRWSPDGKTIVFWDKISEKIYEVSPEGGSPRRLMPDDPRGQEDPNWSPGGDKIVFGSARDIATPSTIRILNLVSRQVSTLPGSQDLFSPRWSPDGRYIVAMKHDSSTLLMFDFQNQKWTELGKSLFGWPNWSKDGRYIYVLDLGGKGAVLKFRISDHKVEQVVDLKNFVSGGQAGNWLALAPDDSPLLLRDVGSQDVYALDWEAP